MASPAWQRQAQWLEQQAESSYLKHQTGSRESSAGNGLGFWNLKSCPQWHTFLQPRDSCKASTNFPTNRGLENMGMFYPSYHSNWKVSPSSFSVRWALTAVLMSLAVSLYQMWDCSSQVPHMGPFLFRLQHPANAWYALVRGNPFPSIAMHIRRRI